MTPQERAVATALAEVGYLGKKSTKHLDELIGDAGGKCTKYARDLDALGDFYNGPKQGADWCDIWVDWVFVHTFGREIGQKMLYQPNRSAGAGTGYSLGYYKSNGRLFQQPELADQIFFGDAKSTWHTGLVVGISDGMVTTVEGNAGTPLGVHQFRYPLDYYSIKGYGRPDWSLAQSDAQVSLEGVPEWALSAVRKCVDKGALRGVGGDRLELSNDLCRTLVVLDRLGKLD